MEDKGLVMKKKKKGGQENGGYLDSSEKSKSSSESKGRIFQKVLKTKNQKNKTKRNKTKQIPKNQPQLPLQHHTHPPLRIGN